MNERLEEVRRDIEATRYALGEKIEKLEDRIETTKNTTLSPAYHVRMHPWPILTAVTLLSCLVGRSLKTKPAPRSAASPGILRTSVVSGITSVLSSGLAFAAANFVRSVLEKRKEDDTVERPFGR